MGDRHLTGWRLQFVDPTERITVIINPGGDDSGALRPRRETKWIDTTYFSVLLPFLGLMGASASALVYFLGS